MTEYEGVKFASGHTMFECVDKTPVAVPGSYRNEDGFCFGILQWLALSSIRSNLGA